MDIQMKLIRSHGLPDRIAMAVIALYFIVGLFIAGTYGVNWDDGFQRQNGLDNWSFITGADRAPLINSLDKYHGPAFEILLVMVEKGFGLADSHDIYLSRHFMVFLFFTSVLLGFFLLCRSIFASSWLGLLGMCLLLLNPRIFAESFYNPKDIVFLGGMVWAMYSLYIFAESPSLLKTIFHAFTCAFAIDVRVIGILCIPITFALLGYYIYRNKYTAKEIWPIAIFYVLILFVFMIMMWPILSLDVFEQLWLAYKQLSNYTLFENGLNIYMGGHTRAGSMPWHYHWVWLLITLPEVYIFLFVAGIIAFAAQLCSRQLMGHAKKAFLFISLFLFFMPLIFRTISLSVVLDGWRHMYFIYPFFVILIVYAAGLALAMKRGMLQYLALGVVALGMADSLVSIIAMHPYQYTYFNHTANAVFSPIDQKFEMDYWGVSYKQGLEYLAEHVTDTARIRIAVANAPGYDNYMFLPPELRRRFQVAADNPSVQYYLTNYRTNWIPAPEYTYHRLTAQGNTVLGIYKLR
jgi:hypothetical protein